MSDTLRGTLLGGLAEVHVGDITRIPVDGVVNAANSSLLGGGGVDGAIHRAGGPAILEACRAVRRDRYPDGLPTGDAVATTAGDLPARVVIHAVGPIYAAQDDPETLLRSAYERSLAIAAERELRSVAFPAISTGVYGYPKDEAAQVVAAALRAHAGRGGPPERVLLVFFSERDAELFLEASGLPR